MSGWHAGGLLQPSCGTGSTTSSIDRVEEVRSVLLKPSSESGRWLGGTSEGRLSAALVLGPASSPAGDLPVDRDSAPRGAASLQ